MPQTIGEQLKLARIDRKITIKKASQATAVRGQFLEALEADNFDSLPSPVQARGFLRIYAGYLGLDAEKLLTTLRGENSPEQELVPEAIPPLSGAPESDSAETEILLNEQESLPSVEFESEEPTEDSYHFHPFDNEELSETSLVIESKSLPLSSSIFIEIGQQLKGRRELLSLTLDEIERHTHIRKRHLIALETGAIDDLPSTVQARGILSSYTKFLDLDGDALLLRFAEGLQASRKERYPQTKTISPTSGNGSIIPPGIRRILTTDLIFGGGMILAMIAFAIWGAIRIISQREQDLGNSNGQQSISEALFAATAVTEEPTSLPTPSLELIVTSGQTEATSTIIEIPTNVKSAPVQVIAAVSGNTWMRITVDGKIKFQGRAIAGSAYPFDGEKSVVVLAADGSMVRIVYNQKDLGLMGNPGEIAEIIYTAQGVLLPSPTPTLTPTRTPRVTPTFTPSITPTPVNTTEPIG